MFKNRKKAYAYLLKVDYSLTDAEGSAVLVPIDSAEYAYVFSAKHTFGKDSDEQSEKGYHKINIGNIDENNVILKHPNGTKFEVLKVLNLIDDIKIDLIVFQIKKDEYIKKLSSLYIYEDSFQIALAYGYPSMKKEDTAPYQAFLGTYKPIDLKNKFELNLKDFSNIHENQNTHTYVEGLSGAGVFVEDTRQEEIYLAGVVVNSGDGNTVKCIEI